MCTGRRLDPGGPVAATFKNTVVQPSYLKEFFRDFSGCSIPSLKKGVFWVCVSSQLLAIEKRKGFGVADVARLRRISETAAPTLLLRILGGSGYEKISHLLDS